MLCKVENKSGGHTKIQGSRHMANFFQKIDLFGVNVSLQVLEIPDWFAAGLIGFLPQA